MGVIVRQSIKGTIINYVGAALGMLTTLFIVTKYLSTEEVGLMRTLIDVVAIFVGLAQIGTNASIFRFFPYFKDPEKRDNGFFFWTLIVPLIGFCLYLFVFLIFKNLISDAFREKSELLVNYFYFIIPLGFFTLYQLVFETNAVVLLRLVVPIFVKEVGIRLMVLVSYFLFAFHYISLTGLVVAFCGTYGIAACINFGYLLSLRRISFKPNFQHITKPLRRDFLFYTLFLMCASLTTAVVPYMGTLFLSAKLGLAFAGIYSIAKHMVTFIEIPYRSLGAITNPHVSQTVKDKNFTETNRLIKKVSLHQFLIGAAIFFVIWTNIDLIYQIIPNGGDYVSGKWVVFILGISTLITTSLSIGSTTLGYSKYYYFSLIFTLILTTSTIILNVKLIPVLGVSGTAIATLVSYGLYYLLVTTLIFWKLKVSPFSFAQLKILALFLILFLLDYLWKQSVSPLVVNSYKPAFWVTFFDALARTTVLGIMGFGSIYLLNISEDVNSLVRKLRDTICKLWH
jgi:O-antigen/teichoic acid export membrane protein